MLHIIEPNRDSYMPQKRGTRSEKALERRQERGEARRQNQDAPPLKRKRAEGNSRILQRALKEASQEAATDKNNGA